MAAPSEVLRAGLRIGTREDMADAVTRSHLADGRVVGWYGEPGVVIDAETAHAAPPPALASRYGSDRFWERWTAAECGAKAHDVPIAVWLRRHGLPSAPVDVTTLHWEGLVVSLARRTSHRGAVPARNPST